MAIDPDLEAVQTLLSFSRAVRQQEATGELPPSGSSSDESQDQWDASSDDGYHKTHLQSAKVRYPCQDSFSFLYFINWLE